MASEQKKSQKAPKSTPPKKPRYNMVYKADESGKSVFERYWDRV